MTGQVMIRPCSNCHADLADPDYEGTLCAQCADEMIGAEIRQQKAALRRWGALWDAAVGILFGLVIAVLLVAIYGVLGWLSFKVGMHIVHWWY
jgi:ABC-type Fe3+ transport system substrate-binding protein